MQGGMDAGALKVELSVHTGPEKNHGSGFKWPIQTGVIHDQSAGHGVPVHCPAIVDLEADGWPRRPVDRMQADRIGTMGGQAVNSGKLGHQDEKIPLLSNLANGLPARFGACSGL
jgi:hypothetical protein